MQCRIIFRRPLWFFRQTVSSRRILHYKRQPFWRWSFRKKCCFQNRRNFCNIQSYRRFRLPLLLSFQGKLWTIRLRHLSSETIWNCKNKFKFNRKLPWNWRGIDFPIVHNWNFLHIPFRRQQGNFPFPPQESEIPEWKEKQGCLEFRLPICRTLWLCNNRFNCRSCFP